MSPVLFISLPFILLLLMSQNAGVSKVPKEKSSERSEYLDGDIVIIRKQSKKQA